jgi:NarL family two-component system response regulator LiaR
VLKTTRLGELKRAIHAAADGQVQRSPQAAALLILEVRAPQPPAETLTEREGEILRLMARGYANKQIARGLTIAEKTVKTHVSSILAKLGLQTRTQAALYAIRTGLVTADQLEEHGAPADRLP